MNDVKKYWRDKVMQLLGAGTGVLIAVAGWSLTETEKFEIGPWAENKNFGTVLRAIALLLFSGAFGLAWLWATHRIYRRYLSDDVDETVLPWPSVRSYIILVGTALLIVSTLVSFG
jgi:hypothetical protein